MGIIASNAFNPGFSTFVCNLIMSTSVSSNIKKKFPDWIVEYCNGLSQEFYCVSFLTDKQNKYVGKSFSHAVEVILIFFLYENNYISKSTFSMGFY